jgi:hypothetical protein
MNIDLINWTGRLGNNIVQLKNAIQVALFYDFNIILPGIKNNWNQNVVRGAGTGSNLYIRINDKITKKDGIVIDDNQFYYAKRITLSGPLHIPFIDNSLFDMNKKKTIEILRNYVVMPKPTTLNENDLVIHIRSGDIFSNQAPTNYIMPPLSYYVDIINNNNFDKIYLLAEDTKNPCINELIKQFPEIHFKLQSLDEDIKILLGATNVVMSYGTMIHALLIFSNNIKNLYSPSYFIGPARFVDIYTQDDGHSRINNFKIELDEYHKKLIPWKNTEEQKNIMITYK